ncbi:MAG: rRNA pseudouridine synthase [Deltaproteobacteria bacterium]|nr:rRNA pseudouridine synthase [Deltaproteobacteria bacterium]
MSKKLVREKRTKKPKTKKPQPFRSPTEKTELNEAREPIRLNRLLSLAGITSRRKADELIATGRVRVNGKVVREPGFKAVWGKDKIHVDDREVPGPEGRAYIMLNKPFGYICAMSDPLGRPLVTDLLDNVKERVYPVGRLDFDTMGLLLFTNDGEWAYRLTHPRFSVPRTYKATVADYMEDTALEMLRSGVRIPGAVRAKGKVTLLSRDNRQTVIRLTITQGVSRQVRKMVEVVGYRVIHLIRTGFGTIELGDLKVGEYRYLETEEVNKMKKLVGMR